MVFSNTFPPGCPPEDAEDAAGIVYRIVKMNPPESDAFKTHAELGKMPHACPCLRHGLSTLRSYEDACHQRDLFPRLGKLIFAGELQPEHGKTKLTPAKLPTHTTWWVYEEVDRASLFKPFEQANGPVGV